MQTNTIQKIPCSVGILTFNSAKTLERTLKSVEDFSDIIISDGGSTDETLEIAKQYGCRVIDQIAKHSPGPEPRHPITDFSAEHNQLLAAAQEEWYLRLDSDEYIAVELRDEIAEVVKTNEFDGCKLQMYLQSPDGVVTYRLPSPIYQPRLVRPSRGHFKRPVHEYFAFTQTPKLKTLTGPWYVPISKPDFQTYKWAVNYRLGLAVTSFPKPNFSQYIIGGIFKPLKRALGIFLRALTARIASPFSPNVPMFYIRNRLYSQWVMFRVQTKFYLLGK